MSNKRRTIPFLGRVSSRRDAPKPRRDVKERMDALLRRAELDAEERALRPATAFEAPAFEPPAVSPWSSPDGEPELRRAWADGPPVETGPVAADGDYDENEDAFEYDGGNFDYRKAGFDDYDDPEDELEDEDQDVEDDLDDNPEDDLEDRYDEDFEDDDFGDDPEARAQEIDPILAASFDAPTLLRGKGYSDSERNVLPFRRRSQQRRIRRLRQHPLVRWMQPLAAAVFLLAIPLSLLAWFLTSPSYAVQEVQVTLGDDHRRVDPAWVEGALGGFSGDNIWLLPLDRVETVLLTHPWIADVALRKRPPGGLEAHVALRREAALFRDAESGLTYVDGRGRRIAPWSAAAASGDDLPILSGMGEEDRLAAAIDLVAEIRAAAPTWASGLSEIEILSEHDYRIFTRDLPFPLLVRSGTIEHKARRLQTLLPRILERFDTVAAVDLRFARRIIIEPVVVGPSRA